MFSLCFLACGVLCLFVKFPLSVQAGWGWPHLSCHSFTEPHLLCFHTCNSSTHQALAVYNSGSSFQTMPVHCCTFAVTLQLWELFLKNHFGICIFACFDACLSPLSTSPAMLRLPLFVLQSSPSCPGYLSQTSPSLTSSLLCYFCHTFFVNKSSKPISVCCLHYGFNALFKLKIKLEIKEIRAGERTMTALYVSTHSSVIVIDRTN